MVVPVARSRQEVIRFAAVGIINTLIGLSVILTCYRILDLGLVLSNAIGYGVGIAVSFVLNGSWTFGAPTYRPKAIAGYAVLVLIAFGVNIILVKTMVALTFPYWISQTGGIVSYSVLVFLGMKYAIFRHQ